MAERVQKARENFLKGYNCAQSVFIAFADLLEITEAEAAKFSSPFGAGFGRVREVMEGSVILEYDFSTNVEDAKRALAAVEKYR